MERGMKLKARFKAWGLNAREIHEQIRGLSIDTIRKLGLINLAESTLDEIERAGEEARQKKLKNLQKAVS